MSKKTFFKNIPVGTVAPITKKPSAGSTGKSGAGFIAKSGKSGGALGSAGKGANVFGSPPKSTKSASVFGASGKGSTGFESKSKSTTFGSSPKSSSTFGTSGKSPSSMTSKSPSFIPLGTTTGKSSYSTSEKKSTLPAVPGDKTTSLFASSPSKSYPSTSFANPKKSKTTFGIIWLPGRKRNKKEYVHVSHRDDGYKRSPSMFPYEQNYMSGDSGTHPFKKKEEENSLLALEKPKGPIATAASAGIGVVALDDKPVDQETALKPPDNSDEKDKEKSELLKYDKEDGKEAAGDASFDEKDNKSFLENDTLSNAFSESKNAKDRGDKVDSVYLRPPPPHKVQSNSSTTEDEDCGIKCLYYTLQCCDCVLM